MQHDISLYVVEMLHDIEIIWHNEVIKQESSFL